MRCDDFESIIADLTRGEAVTESEERDARDHSALCERCSQFFEQSQELTDRLARLAVSDRLFEAPSSVEDELREAFRSRQDFAEVPAGVLSLKSGSAKIAAIAAVALLILIGVLISLKIAGKARMPARGDERAVVTVPAPTVAPPPENRSQDLAVQKKSPDEKRVAASDKPSRREPVAVEASNQPHRGGLRLASQRATASRDDSDEAGQQQEITTDFLAVGPPGSWRPIDGGGVIVRVELPRTALMNYGLPVAPSRTNSLVKADVLVGEDGFPRAVRFVR